MCRKQVEKGIYLPAQPLLAEKEGCLGAQIQSPVGETKIQKVMEFKVTPREQSQAQSGMLPALLRGT